MNIRLKTAYTALGEKPGFLTFAITIAKVSSHAVSPNVYH